MASQASKAMGPRAVLPTRNEDLRARFHLTQGRAASMQEVNLFYDRDAAGDYYQFYSRAFEKRFFFEIIERNGYAGCGINNAGVRLAAQARYRFARDD